MSAWLDRLRDLDPERDPVSDISEISETLPPAPGEGEVEITEITETRPIGKRGPGESEAQITQIGSIEKRGPAPASTFPCPGCRRPLPIARRADRDFSRCVCCKLATSEARHRRRR
jgi:hypothetical protein